MANLMKAGKEWFDKAETQQYFADNGVTWTSDELADKVFECGKSWMYKCIKASNVDAEVVDKFKEQCKVLQTDGYKLLKLLRIPIQTQAIPFSLYPTDYLHI